METAVQQKIQYLLIMEKKVVNRFFALTKTEEKILRAHASGKTMSDILSDFCISITTYRTHMHNIYTKLVLDKGENQLLMAVLWYLKKHPDLLIGEAR